MYFIKVENLPPRYRRRRGRNDLKEFFEFFINSRTRYAKFVYSDDDYKNTMSAYTSLTSAVKRYGMPIRIHMRGGDIFIEKVEL